MDGEHRVSVGQAVATTTICLWVIVLLAGTVVYTALRGGISFELSDFRIVDALPFVGIGFAAAFVDGALGMGFGAISSVLLVSGGLPPAVASMSVHTVETFTTAASGISHVRQGNVDWRLFVRLAWPGIVGGLLGAIAILYAPVGIARPVVLTYLALVGALLVFRSARRSFPPAKPNVVGLLGLTGGFFDASGGGGWGPIVAGGMLLQNVHPRHVVGTINLAEFFVTAVVAIFFTTAVGIPPISVATLGLLAGGLMAAPLAARMSRRIAPRPLMFSMGILLLAVSVFDLGSGAFRQVAVAAEG